MTDRRDAPLGEALCMNLRSFRKNGTPVDTPVWVVPFGRGVAFFTDGRSFKARRIAHDPRVEVAPCDVWGNVLGHFRPGKTRPVSDPADAARVYGLMKQKYGIHWTLARLGRGLARTMHHRAVFEIELVPRHEAPWTERAICVLRATNVHKRHARGTIEVNAVNGVSLDVRAGEMVAIAGPSGSGKSTLLNLFGALDTPSSGEVSVAGWNLDTDTVRTRLRRRKVGFVFQFFNLLPLLSARENITLPLLLSGVAPKDARARASELLGQVGLSHRENHRPDALSGGEMQRVAIARALGPRPLLLLADEPTGNLDSSAGKVVLGLLREAARDEGCAVILVTHDPVAAREADRVIELKDGQIVSESARAAIAPGET